ncbi:MAG: glutamate synthase large subunit [Bacteroidota bacterium]
METDQKTIPTSNRGLYVPELEKDSCGTGLIANLNGDKSHQLVLDALQMLENMEHRGACGCEPDSGDGAGILVQVPDLFFRKELEKTKLLLPPFGQYGVGMVFFPVDPLKRKACKRKIKKSLAQFDLELLGYRKVPVNLKGIGKTALSAKPEIEQIFVRSTDEISSKDLERRLFVFRKYISHRIKNIIPDQPDMFYICSFSYKTIVYKGQLTTYQLKSFYPDLERADFKSAIALVHSRFSTNTVPKWKLAQPFRYIAHNGEINTIKGNLNWWKAREKSLDPKEFSSLEIEQITPICAEGSSDSGNFDNVLEFISLSGRSIAHALMMMIPEAWQEDRTMADYKRAFYEYHAQLIEPWDGPASICFTDGILVGATLDRNGLRPSRYLLTKDNVLVVASEAGALPLDQSTVILKGRLQPGKILISDLDEKRIIADDELKSVICQRLNYREWLDNNKVHLAELPMPKKPEFEYSGEELLVRQKLFGYSIEDLKVILAPMINHGKDPIGSMGTDTPLAILSRHSQHLANYFKQLFSQVTNPPIDPIRERSVMSTFSKLGGAGQLFGNLNEQPHFIPLRSPVLRPRQFRKIKGLDFAGLCSKVIDIVIENAGVTNCLETSLDTICRKAETLVKDGANILILSDSLANQYYPPIPSLLVVGAVHHHLIKKGLRLKTSLVVDAGDAWESHHLATLTGYGADAIYPRIAYATIKSLNKNKVFSDMKNGGEVIERYCNALEKSLLKIMSKLGISTLDSYKGAQCFEALGVHHEVVNRCFTGTVTRIGGIDFEGVMNEIYDRVDYAFFKKDNNEGLLCDNGIFQWKKKGEYHLFNPQSIHLLQHSTATGNYSIYKKFADLINGRSEEFCTLRSMLSFRKGKPVPIEEVESVENILKRFVTGAMSFGSISHEAHTTLAVAMNRIGGKSNSGEGGEDPSRFVKKPNGDWERSATKQVASGRFGVTANYLTNADEIQIKMAQGAKPGEGGQLPGHKVDEWIGRVRHSTPGVGLISPPPHHDIYSIEDLAQLIFDLKNANRNARINVKLVSKAGVGIIASGVAKAHADAILISGHDGGTGASPITSIRHAGLPWELGLAETHQTLVKNKLRNRVVLQTDGQIRTGRDMAIATLLGAEEWGIATAALVVEGCILMRKCHLNTCPVGIATQDPKLRKRFNGKVEHLVNYFTFLAMDLREIMAELGFKTINEMVGKTELLETNTESTYWKLQKLDLTPLLFREPEKEETALFKQIEQDHGIEEVLDWKLLDMAKVALNHNKSYNSILKVRNTNRAVGTLMSNEITKMYGAKGLTTNKLLFWFRGSAGQSFGAFTVNGLHFVLEGEANDYFGKGLSGGKLIVFPDRKAEFKSEENIIIGNVALYGATSGEIYVRGMAGERFAIRNSGASAVVEGLGDHGCEYMTGGKVVVLGETGKNFGAGMSGGIAFIYDVSKTFKGNCNTEMVDLDPLDAEDFATIRLLIRQHFRYTGSEIALSILNNWKVEKAHFVKVMPSDYKAILSKNRIMAKAS